jgi:hypothetical protein
MRFIVQVTEFVTRLFLVYINGKFDNQKKDFRTRNRSGMDMKVKTFELSTSLRTTHEDIGKRGWRYRVTNS